MIAESKCEGNAGEHRRAGHGFDRTGPARGGSGAQPPLHLLLMVKVARQNRGGMNGLACLPDGLSVRALSLDESPPSRYIGIAPGSVACQPCTVGILDKS